jgi:hypothetical protein
MLILFFVEVSPNAFFRSSLIRPILSWKERSHTTTTTITTTARATKGATGKMST